MEEKSKKVVASALACAVALGVAMPSVAIAAEKCHGIVKAGKNDCAANGHSCAGQSTVDGDPNEWVYLPDGTCGKLVNGSTKPSSK